MGKDNHSRHPLVNNPEATERTKQVDVAYHTARDYLDLDINHSQDGQGTPKDTRCLGGYLGE